MTTPETPEGLRRRLAGCEADRSHILLEYAKVLARLATAEADAEAGWKWAWSFDQWTEHGATASLTDEARAEFQRDLATHENRDQP